eukprot:969164-Pyramimonas_sp.AAC.1
MVCGLCVWRERRQRRCERADTGRRARAIAPYPGARYIAAGTPFGIANARAVRWERCCRSIARRSLNAFSVTLSLAHTLICAV